MKKLNVPTTCKVAITSYKANGKFYTREIANITFDSNYPMLDEDFEEKIMDNSGLVNPQPITTFEWVGGQPVGFLLGSFVNTCSL